MHQWFKVQSNQTVFMTFIPHHNITEYDPVIMFSLCYYPIWSMIMVFDATWGKFHYASTNITLQQCFMCKYSGWWESIFYKCTKSIYEHIQLNHFCSFQWGYTDWGHILCINWDLLFKSSTYTLHWSHLKLNSCRKLRSKEVCVIA